MKIGLLECDHVADKLRHIGGDYLDMFAALFPQDDLIPFDACNGEFPDNLDACDAYMCTGSRHSVYDDIPWIIRLRDFVRELHAREKTFVGVCFGHQMLGHALGGRVAKSEAGWCVGVHGFQVHQHESWMTPQLPSYNLLMMCQDQILELPPGATVLSSTAKCPVGMVKIGSGMLGFQAHPEFPVAYERALLEIRTRLIGEETVRIALESLDQRLDTTAVRDWMRAFILRIEGLL
jgi:GMP synthase-like glutamine amidotransferase